VGRGIPDWGWPGDSKGFDLVLSINPRQNGHCSYRIDAVLIGCSGSLCSLGESIQVQGFSFFFLRDFQPFTACSTSYLDSRLHKLC
jgi:hypothetical protein